MKGLFVVDLDFALNHLYAAQYLGSGDTWSAAVLNAMGVEPWDALRGHENCVAVAELSLKLLGSRKGVPTAQGVFVIEQLLLDGYISLHEHETSASGHIRLTNAGRMFKERGGYGRLRRSEWWKSAWRIAATSAAAINAVAVIVLTWWAAQSADADKLQDEQIIQLDRKNAALEERNTALFNEVQALHLELKKTSLDAAVDTTRAKPAKQ